LPLAKTSNGASSALLHKRRGHAASLTNARDRAGAMTRRGSWPPLAFYIAAPCVVQSRVMLLVQETSASREIARCLGCCRKSLSWSRALPPTVEHPTPNKATFCLVPYHPSPQTTPHFVAKIVVPRIGQRETSPQPEPPHQGSKTGPTPVQKKTAFALESRVREPNEQQRA
jgi:hypothetical protein